MSETRPDIAEIGSHFRIGGKFVSAEVCKLGHINDTYVSTYDRDGTRVRYVHQRVNHNVFGNVPALMENIGRVTEHGRRKLAVARVGDLSRRMLQLAPTLNGASYHVDAGGDYWRTYLFIDRALTCDFNISPRQAFEAARAFGRFLDLMADLPPPRLHETIVDFHNTPARFAALAAAVRADRCGRVSSASREIDFAMSRRSITDRLVRLHLEGAIPERVTHNDTKLNNVMMDEQTGEGICVIDLDTVMPGLVHYDFGDMVRSATNSAREDEPDLSKVHFRRDIFEALLRGYLEAAGQLLVPAEIEHLAFSGLLISFEIGIRFLTDFLLGDVYFKVHREDQNLDRCRVQFKLVRDMEDARGEMERLVFAAAAGVSAPGYRRG